MTSNLRCQPHELRLVRVYRASVIAVWDAWNHLDEVSQWWGPRGFLLTHHSKELVSGGHWHYTMHGPDGTDYENYTVYHEVIPHVRMVYDHGGNRDQPPLFRVTVEFKEADGHTTMDMVMAFESAQVAADMKTFIKEAGGDATWDRLAEYLLKKREEKDAFVLTRSFKSSCHDVFAMWVNPEHLCRWLPPKNFEMTFFRDTIEEGSSTFYKMVSGDVVLFGRTHYLKIIPGQKIVMKQEFCDQDERPSKHPLAPELPSAFVTTVEFLKEGSGTRQTLTSFSSDDATNAEIARFVEERFGMGLGWGGSFDALEDQLKNH